MKLRRIAQAALLLGAAGIAFAQQDPSADAARQQRMDEALQKHREAQGTGAGDAGAVSSSEARRGTIGEQLQQSGRRFKSDAKQAGREVADGTRRAGRAVAGGARKAGKAVADGARKTGRKIRETTTGSDKSGAGNR